VSLVEKNAVRWLAAVIPTGRSIVLYSWRERDGGADFHARFLLTDKGGMKVEAGFSAAAGCRSNLDADPPRLSGVNVGRSSNGPSDTARSSCLFQILSRRCCAEPIRSRGETPDAQFYLLLAQDTPPRVHDAENAGAPAGALGVCEPRTLIESLAAMARPVTPRAPALHAE